MRCFLFTKGDKKMGKSEKKLNASVHCEKKGRFTNLFVDIPTKDGDIHLLVKPITKDGKTLSKLLYKIECSLGD